MAASPLRRLLRALHALHRKLGALSFAMCTLWFASGIVMVFARYPDLKEQSRLRLAEPLDSVPSTLSVAALSAVGPVASGEVRLVEALGRVAWRVERGGDISLLWTDGRVALQPAFQPDEVVSALAGRLKQSVQQWRVVLEPDQWTLYSRHLPSFPLVHVTLGDAAGTELYASLRTGQVVQQTEQPDRLWAYAGAIPHWVYPAFLRRERGIWRMLVLTLAAMGLFASLTGLALGVRLVIRARARTSRWSPFCGVLRVHHLLGFAFGGFACTWLFSGMLSLNPFSWSPGNAPRPETARILAGGELMLSGFRVTPHEALLQCGFAVRELVLVQWHGEPYYRCLAEDRSSLVRAAELTPATSMLSERSVSEAAQRLGTVVHERLREPDAYFYPRPGADHYSMPVDRIRIQNRTQTTLYVDPKGAVLVQEDVPLSQIERWLYLGLHRADFAWLRAIPFLRETLVLIAMLLGLGLCGSGALRWAARRR